MSRSSQWALLGLACGASLALAGLAQAQGAGDATTRAKKLIEGHAKKVCEYAHAPKTYTFKGARFVSTSKTKDGRFEVTYQFTVKGNLKTQKMDISFFFKDGGDFDFVRTKDYTTIYEPFKNLSASYLRSLRQATAKMPAVAGNTDLLKRVDSANAQALCEIFLRETQIAEMKK
jgi:hypothetical protein